MSNADLLARIAELEKQQGLPPSFPKANGKGKPSALPAYKPTPAGDTRLLAMVAADREPADATGIRLVKDDKGNRVSDPNKRTAGTWAVKLYSKMYALGFSQAKVDIIVDSAVERKLLYRNWLPVGAAHKVMLWHAAWLTPEQRAKLDDRADRIEYSEAEQKAAHQDFGF